MAANYPVQEYGITGFVHMRRHKIGLGGNGTNVGKDNLDINSVPDNKPVRINSRDYAQTSGSSIGFQCKPNQAVAGASVSGCEIQPRFASGIGGVNLIGANISAILKGVTGNLTGEVHVLELETDFDQNQNPTRTITGDVCLLRLSGGFPNTMTFSGKKSAIQMAPAQSGPYDAFIKWDSTNTDLISANAAAGTARKVKCLFGSTTVYINIYEA